ncbi:MAG: DUF4407 domain-containing protein [Bacteroidota bacterium]
MENQSREFQKNPPTQEEQSTPKTINELYAQHNGPTTSEEPELETSDQTFTTENEELATTNDQHTVEEEHYLEPASTEAMPVDDEIAPESVPTINERYQALETEIQEEEEEPILAAESFQGHEHSTTPNYSSINDQYANLQAEPEPEVAAQTIEPPSTATTEQPEAATINERFAQATHNTSPPSATPTEPQKLKKSWFKQFFLFASGVDTEILEQCPSDENKYLGIGGTVFFTGVLAFLSASYAIYTIFDSWFMGFFFGLVWGLMIFNLDRYIVASMKKQGSWWKDFGMAAPRLLMAILLALVISKPLELKIFEKEINAELITMEQEVYAEQEGKVKSRFESQIVTYQGQIDEMEAELAAKRFKRDTLEMMAIQEADGTGGSGNRNLGPIYRAKKAEADQADQELKAAEAQLLPAIAENRLAINELQDKMQTEIDRLERSAYGGMAARMEALHRLGQDSSAIWWASLMIMLLFICVETAPIMVKLISSRSPYDYLLLQYEHSVETATKEKVTLANNELKNKIQFETETNIYRTEQEIAVEKEMIDYYLQRRKDALKTYPVDWEKPFIHSDIKESRAIMTFNSSYNNKEDQTTEKTINEVYAESA